MTWKTELALERDLKSRESGTRWEEGEIESSAAGRKVGRVHTQRLYLVSTDSIREL